MKKMLSSAVLTGVMLLPLMSSTVLADDALNERVNRLERIVKGQGLVSLLGRVDQLQQEVQRLNGDNEALRHQLELMKRRQREMYIDLDGRFSQLQTPNVAITEQSVTPSQPSAAVEAEEVAVQQPVVDVVDASTSVQQQGQNTVDNVSAPASPVAVENGEAAYQAALQTLRSGQYAEAITALAAFPEQYPQSHYLPNTYYWQGEANYVLRNFDLAIASFQTVIDRFPVSSKVPDALLKQAFSQYELGQIDVAKANLAKVIEQYPTTSAARLAKVRLERLEKEAQ